MAIDGIGGILRNCDGWLRDGKMTALLYILKCRDGSYYAGSARGELEARILDHEQARYNGYTARRLPVRLVFAQEFQRIEDAVAAERQVKGWSRAKKEALIRGDFDALPGLAARRKPRASGTE